MAKMMNPTKVVTGVCRFSYANLWEPKAMDENSKAKYSVSLIIPKSDTKTLDKMNKLKYSRKQLLLPLYESICIQGCDESINRIHCLQGELQKLSEKKDTLRKLRAQDIIDSVVFNQEINFIDTQAAEYRTEITNLCGETKDFSELNNLICFTDREMMTEFNDEIFDKFVIKIVIINRNCAEFHLRCGLKIKEAL